MLLKTKTRTRFPPSPTGPFHVGGARTALFNFIFARQTGGDFILRIEDTDKERSDKRFEDDILAGLKWLKLDHDEFYRQSEREEVYEKYLTKLLKNNTAFWCNHTREELAQEKTIQMQNKQPLRHACDHKLINTNKKGIIRLKSANKKIKFHDLVRGEIEYDGDLLGDMAIAKNEKTPLYNFAVVVDDYEMKISHIIRGEDHISNTPKQILIQEALEIERPTYAHLPLILGLDRSKLSKRHAATSVNEYKKDGYLSEAFINFMVLLGWNPGDNREVIDIKEIIKIFSLEKTQKGGAIFNLDKLNWFNKEYINNMAIKDLSLQLTNYIPLDWQNKIKEDPSYWEKIVEMEKPRLTKLSEIKSNTEYFFEKPKFPQSLIAWKEENLDQTGQHIDKLIILLSNIEIPLFNSEEIKKTIWNYAEEKGKGSVLWPFRVALTGQAKSPDPFSVAEILGKKETLERLNYAKQMIHGKPIY